MTFNFTKNKFMAFDVEVEGLDKEELNFFFRVLINDVEYGFKGDYKNGKVKLNIPAFNTIVKEKVIENGKSYEAKLEAYDDKVHIIPWNDSISFDVEPEVKAELTTEEVKQNIEKPKIIAKAKIAEVEEKPKIRSSKDILNEKVNKFKNISKFRKTEPTKKKITKQVIKETKTVEKQQNIKGKTTKQDLINLMESVGMVTQKTQDRMLDKVQEMGGEDYKSQYKSLRQLLGLDKPKTTTDFFHEKYKQEDR